MRIEGERVSLQPAAISPLGTFGRRGHTRCSSCASWSLVRVSQTEIGKTRVGSCTVSNCVVSIALAWLVCNSTKAITAEIVQKNGNQWILKLTYSWLYSRDSRMKWDFGSISMDFRGYSYIFKSLFRGSVGRRSSLKVESHLIHHHSSTLCLINLISILGLLPTFICHRSGSIWFGAWRWSGNAQRGRGCVRERSVARLAKNWVDD